MAWGLRALNVVYGVVRDVLVCARWMRRCELNALHGAVCDELNGNECTTAGSGTSLSFQPMSNVTFGLERYSAGERFVQHDIGRATASDVLVHNSAAPNSECQAM